MFYAASHAVYPSPHWAGKKMTDDMRYRELINPSMNDDVITEEQALQIECMLAEQGGILQQRGNVYLLNPLEQNIDQYLFGVPAIQDCKQKVKYALDKFGFLTKDGYLNKAKYDHLNHSQNSLDIVCKETKKESFSDEHMNAVSSELNEIAGNAMNAVNSALNGIAGNAMDTIYFANMWLHLGSSEYLSNRPVVVLQSPKYATRQIERYYAIIASMALGITPVQIGGNSKGEVYDFEGMADVIPTIDREGRPVIICYNSSRTDPKCYANINDIYKGLSIGPLQRFVIVECQEKYKDLIYHMDLAIQVDEEQYLYLAENLFTAESYAQLRELVGEERIVYIPEEEWKLYALNVILFDSRFQATKKTAIVRIGCPVLAKELEKRKYEVFKKEEKFPNGGGSARCRLAFFEKGRQHDLESFLREQCLVEDKLGASYAVVPRSKMDDFKLLYDSMDLQRIIYKNTKE